MQLRQLWLTDFRCYLDAHLDLPAGFTVVVGSNGEGKTSLLEAIAWLATSRSFRGVPDSALVRAGTERAVTRGEIDRNGSAQLVEAEIRAAGRNRILVNHQALPRLRDLVDALRVTVFSPDDLGLVKGGPAERRRYLDDLLVASAPRYEAARTDFERVLRQRNALLRSGASNGDVRSTLDVFDQQLAGAGGEIVRGRLRLGSRLAPAVCEAYEALAGTEATFGAQYEAEWAEGPVPASASDGVDEQLMRALTAARRREMERGTTLVGPHRDDWRLQLGALEARTHASQGEQRTLALALRLAGHRLSAELLGEPPVLLLDDVFSELDPQRSSALVRELPPGQTLLTTAGAMPREVHPERTLHVRRGVFDDA